MEKPKIYTMKDIATELGISVATVSRALSDSPRISNERKELIRKFAQEHNFRPNAIAENLRNSRVKPQKLIGVIVPELIHFFFSSVLSGIEKEASRRGYRIMLAQSLESYEHEVQICESFYMNRVCGIIVSMAKDTHHYSHFAKLMDEKVPLVFYDRICTGVDASRVVVDDYHGSYTAVSHLIESGYKRIAFYGCPMHLEIVKNRLNGYKDALLKHGIPVDENLIYVCDNRTLAEAITPDVLSQRDAPDGFFAVNDDTAIGVLYTAKRLGYNVPEDIGICGFTNGQRAVACEPRLTTIDQPGEELGRQAADILISQVEGTLSLDKPHKRIVRTTLIKRGTTKN